MGTGTVSVSSGGKGLDMMQIARWDDDLSLWNHEGSRAENLVTICRSVIALQQFIGLGLHDCSCFDCTIAEKRVTNVLW